MYRRPSPSPSSDSLSDNDEDDVVNKSTFFADPVAASPARWSYPRRPSIANSASHISRLPTEIVIHILRYLHTPRDLYRSMLVCRTWCECSVELLWHKPSFGNVSTLIKMMRVLSSDEQAFTYARFIRRLNFLFLGPDLSDVLFSRVAQCVRLERLTLVNCQALSNEAMTRAFQSFPHLVAIDLTGVLEVTDKAILALALYSKRLQGINLGGCKKITDEGVSTLARSCPLLRRVKLSGLEQITDRSVSALARSCPLILEIDLNNCRHITDHSIRDLWTHSYHMREMRLSHCEQLTDAAFPAPIRPELGSSTLSGPNPFPVQPSISIDAPPLKLPRRFEHLRMLDLTSCGNITDDAVEGIVTAAPKIRNLVLAKCGQLTDRSVDVICRLGKHLHYLHLGHCSSITDNSIKNLARSCTRLRYIDLANCTLLTDMSVFELASLPKLRRVGLVRVSNLTDEAIYALGERHATLERIHLSYCNRLSAVSIHFLLQRLPKLTHLSLTGVPAFRRPEFQRFCRSPPADFNSSQRAAFCVFSGKGVGDLRDYLTLAFATLAETMGGTDENTEYNDDPFEDQYGGTYMEDDVADVYEPDEGDPDVDMDRDDGTERRIQHQVPSAPVIVPSMSAPASFAQMTAAALHLHDDGMLPSLQMSSNHHPIGARNHGSSQAPLPLAVFAPVAQANRNSFGNHPIIEAPSPPPPSDTGSARSAGTGGTVQSNGAGFFRALQARDAGTISPSSRNQDGGALTPDLIFAEIGHGRGTGAVSRTHASSFQSSHQTTPGDASPYGSQFSPGGGGYSMNSFAHSSSMHVLADSSNSPQHPANATVPAWDRRMTGPSSSSLSLPRSHFGPSSSSSSLLQAAIQPSSSSISSSREARDQTNDGRTRGVKRSVKNTLNAAEHFLFGRGDGSSRGNGPSGDASTRAR